VAGGLRDRTGLVGRHLPSVRGHPDQRQPMPQVESISDEPTRGAIGNPQHTTELSSREVPDRRGALPTQPDRVFGAREPALHNSLTSVQVGPMRSDLQPTDLRGDQDAFVGLGRGEGADRIQLHQIIFEHIYQYRARSRPSPTIRRATANGQHLTDPDNICAHVCREISCHAGWATVSSWTRLPGCGRCWRCSRIPLCLRSDLGHEDGAYLEAVPGRDHEASEMLDKSLRKPDYPGWHGLEESRVRTKDEELAKKHFRKVKNVLDDFYRAGAFRRLWATAAGT
jgi:hypothetical protein